MYAPSYRLKSFEILPDKAKGRVLVQLLEALSAANEEYLAIVPQTPLLYESGVRYEEEPPGRDEWQDIPDTLWRRSGDCEDLTAWRMAELRKVFGEHANWLISVDDLHDRTGRIVTTYHIAIRRANGAEEDPSRLLGMP